MTRNPDLGSVKLIYKHLESDVEFKRRLYDEIPHTMATDVPSKYGSDLDDYVWALWSKQRKIVEVVPK